jgi:phage virion morphogenesis protein
MSEGAGVRIEGHDEALATLREISGRVSNPRELFDNIGKYLVSSTRRRFETGVGADGSPWPPSLRVLAHGGKTLVDSARLMQSVTFLAADNAVEVGSNVDYAAIHQFGGDIKQSARSQDLHFKKHKRTGKLLKGFRKAKDGNVTQTVQIPARTITMPARPFLGIDDDDAAQITTIAETWLASDGAPQ